MSPVVERGNYFVGEQIVISGCSFTAMFVENLAISWIKDNEVVKNVQFSSKWENGQYVLSVDSMSIDNFTLGDAGNYHCQLYSRTMDILVVSAKTSFAVSSKSFLPQFMNSSKFALSIKFTFSLSYPV